MQPINRKAQVEEPVPEQLLLPSVEALVPGAILLLAAVTLDMSRVEELLGDTDKSALTLAVLGHQLESAGACLMVNLVSNPRNEPNECLFGALNKLNKTEVILVHTTLDADPLMLFQSGLAHFSTKLEDMRHGIVRDHFNQIPLENT